jgi:hypothetical protein
MCIITISGAFSSTEQVQVQAILTFDVGDVALHFVGGDKTNVSVCGFTQSGHRIHTEYVLRICSDVKRRNSQA